MEDEFVLDIRKYIKIALKNWKWLATAAFLAGVAVFLIVSILPPRYEASALVAIAKPRYTLSFDPKFETVTNSQPIAEAFVDLATSNDIVDGLFESLRNEPGISSAPDKPTLKSMMAVRAGSASAVLILGVSAEDPVLAQTIANLWADLFTQQSNTIFGQADPAQIVYLQDELAKADNRMATAQKALEQIQAQNRESIITAQLTSLLADRAEALGRLREIQYLNRRIQAEEEILKTQPSGTLVDLGNQLVVIKIQWDASRYSILHPEVEWQISNLGELQPVTADSLIAQLTTLGGVLEPQAKEIQQSMGPHDTEILQLQSSLQEQENKRTNAEQERDLADEVVKSISRKLTEIQVASEAVNTDVRIMSKAALPGKPASSNRVIYSLLAAGLGFGIALMAIFVLDWWCSPTDAKKENKKSHKG